MTERRLKQAMLKPAPVAGFRNTHGNWRHFAEISDLLRHLAAISDILWPYLTNGGLWYELLVRTIAQEPALNTQQRR